MISYALRLPNLSVASIPSYLDRLFILWIIYISR